MTRPFQEQGFYHILAGIVTITAVFPGGTAVVPADHFRSMPGIDFKAMPPTIPKYICRLDIALADTLRTGID